MIALAGFSLMITHQATAGPGKISDWQKGLDFGKKIPIKGKVIQVHENSGRIGKVYFEEKTGKPRDLYVCPNQRVVIEYDTVSGQEFFRKDRGKGKVIIFGFHFPINSTIKPILTKKQRESKQFVFTNIPE